MSGVAFCFGVIFFLVVELFLGWAYRCIIVLSFPRNLGGRDLFLLAALFFVNNEF